MKKTLALLVIAIFAFGMLTADMLSTTAHSTIDVNIENTRDQDPPVGFAAELQDYNKASLTWMAPGSAAILWDQTDPEGETYGKTAQDFEASYNVYDAEVAGDFVLDGEAELTGAILMYFYSIADYTEMVQFNITIYPDDAGMPGEEAIHSTGTSLANYGDLMVDYTVDFDEPVTLAAGTYWMVFNMRLDYEPDGIQCYAYQKASVVNETPGYWRNPGMGFEGATGDWEVITSQAGTEEDATFAVLGNLTGTRDFIGYNIYRDAAIVNADAPIAATEYLDEGLTEGTHVYYLVAVYDEGDSEPTNTISLDVVLGAPQNLNCTVAGFNVVCTWQAPATTRDVTYRIYRDDVMVDERQSTQYVDINPPAGDHTYYVTVLYSGDIESAHSNEVEVSIGTDSEDTTIPVSTSFNSIYPNPFNPTTNLFYSVNTDNNVNLSVYNLKGQLVATIVDGYQVAGNYKVIWDGTDNNGSTVPSGIYLSKFQAGDYTSTKKMILMK